MKKRSTVLGAALFCGILFFPAAGHPQDTPTPQPTPASSSRPLDEGIALFGQKQYVQALPLFTQALQLDRTSRAYYYLATCQYLTGDPKEAALNYYLMDRLRPAPQQRAFADKIRDKLTLEDQDWLEKQLRPSTPMAAPSGVPDAPLSSTAATPATSLQVPLAGPFGLRASVDLSLLNMQDFVTEGNSLDTIARQFQTFDSTLTYNSSVPGIGTFVQLNPFYAMGNFEMGVKFSYLLPISATYNRRNSYGYAVNFEDDFSAFTMAAVGRFYIPAGQGVQFFIEPTLGVQPVHMDFLIQYQGTTSTPPNDQYGFHVDDTALDAALKVGFQFVKSNHFTISLVGGYEYALAQNLRGTYFDIAYPSQNGAPGQAVMAHNSAYNNNLIWFLPDDPSKISFFYGSSTDYKSARPLVVDLSGIRASLDFAYWF